MLDSLIAFINKYITRNGNNEITGPVLNDVLIRIANILGSKVDKVEGKGLSTQDYTTADRNKLNGVEDGAQVNIINSVEVNGLALTPTPEGIIDIEIPVKVSELDNDKNYQTRADVELSVVGAKFNLANGIITFTRMNGTTFIIDLPTEMIVKSGYYDDAKGEIVLVLADNTEIRVPVSKLVNEYYGDNSTIELYSDSNDGYKFKFKISEAYKRKIDGAEQTANMVKAISESATDVQYPSAKAVWNSVKGLATNAQAFTQANTRDEIKSGETISVIFGKIKKWFADLKAVAFSGSYNDLSNRPEIGNGTITITQNGAAKGSFTTNQTGNATINLSDENTTYGIGNSTTAGLVKSDSSNVEIRNDGKMIARRADLADYAKYGVRGFKASKTDSAIKYALFGVVGLPLSGESDLYFSCTIEVQGAASGSPLLGKYNVFVHAKGDTTYSGQIGCVYTSNGVSDIIIGEVVRSAANSQGMLYLWANVSHLTTTQEAYNISVYGDINNDLEVRQNVHTTSIPYYSGVLINPELHVSIATSTTPGLVKSGTDITVDASGNVSVNNATKATHDGSGNNIASTYLKLAGGNMTGNVRRKEGDYVALIPSKQYSSYYLQFMKITYVGASFDVPIEIRLSGRGSHQYIIQVNNTSGGVDKVTFYTIGNPVGDAVGIYYKYDSTEKTLSLMFHHAGGGGWEAAAVTDVIVPNNHWGKFTFDYTITEVGLRGWTKADMTTFHYAISERANRDGDGNIINNIYLKKSQYSFTKSVSARGSGWYLIGYLQANIENTASYRSGTINLTMYSLITQEHPLRVGALTYAVSANYHKPQINISDSLLPFLTTRWDDTKKRVEIWGYSEYPYSGFILVFNAVVDYFVLNPDTITELKSAVEGTPIYQFKTCLELTDSNLATYFSNGTLTIPNGVTTVLFNTSSTKKVSNIVGTCAVNGYRLTIAGQWLPVQKTLSSTTGCFSSYIYDYRAGAASTSFDGATNRLTEAFEDFIYFNGVWYSKAY